MARVTIAAAAVLGLSGCSGPVFYRDVIVPTYRQVDPAGVPTTSPAPTTTQRP